MPRIAPNGGNTHVECEVDPRRDQSISIVVAPGDSLQPDFMLDVFAGFASRGGAYLGSIVCSAKGPTGVLRRGAVVAGFAWAPGAERYLVQLSPWSGPLTAPVDVEFSPGGPLPTVGVVSTCTTAEYKTSAPGRERVAQALTGPARVFTVACELSSAAAADGWMLLFDRAAGGPAPGDVPSFPPIRVVRGAMTLISSDDVGLPVFKVSNGLVVALSSAEAFADFGADMADFFVAWSP